MSQPPVVLTIAGSDSGGGAGLQADLKSFAALGTFGTCAVTAVTAQNTAGVRGVHVLPAAFVLAQLEAVLDDLPVVAVKTGMLADAAIVNAVATLAEAGRLPNLVVDPVLAASSGDRLLEPAAVARYVERLLPCARVVTPNLPEAERLLGRSLTSLDEVRTAAAELRDHGCDVVVIKGGHAPAGAGHAAIDVWCDARGVHLLAGPRISTANTHGTGCSFAAAITARLAHGDAPPAAIAFAKRFVAGALTAAADWRLGSGPGPLDQLGWRGS